MHSPQLELASAIALSAAAVMAPSVMAQSPYATVRSPEHRFFGEGVTIMGDVDGDGFDDYVVTTRIEHHVFSGRTGTEIARVVGEAGNDNRVVASAGDVNNDGCPDLLVGKEGFFGPPAEGVATVLSGKDWSEIWEWTGSVAGEGYSAYLAGVGDVDADGHDDVAVGSPQYGTPLPGYVEVYSGRTGALLRQFMGGYIAAAGDMDGDGRDDVIVSPGGITEVRSVSSGSTILSIAGSDGISVGDIDGDGVSDIAVADPFASGVFQQNGAVRVFSGATAAEIRTFWGSNPRQRFGAGLMTVGDVNGDGYSEVLVASLNSFFPTRLAEVIDLRNDAVLYTTSGPQEDIYGEWTGAGGDINGDGVPDALVAAPQPRMPAPSGYVDIISGATLSLLTNTQSVSLSVGGTQTLSLEAGKSYAGSTYVVLGSVSGIEPGVTYGGVTIPLNLDSYLLFTLSFPSTAPLGASLGTLDANGSGRAFFSIPGGVLPSVLAERITFHHAYALLSPAGLPIFASNPMPATLVN